MASTPNIATPISTQILTLEFCDSTVLVEFVNYSDDCFGVSSKTISKRDEWRSKLPHIPSLRLNQSTLQLERWGSLRITLQRDVWLDFFNY
ncbi:unnamed protein product [Trifolium pratense]|uniref:Uncharacterized protein n=1 Tax=Trifolium pratense TaxID=57577 RepID=A0ACB0KZG7_TRIPR|nr:unnamed protein product [Trifolium pratense]